MIDGRVDPICLDYQTDVPLSPIEAAAEHGNAGIEEPGQDATGAISKLMRR